MAIYRLEHKLSGSEFVVDKIIISQSEIISILGKVKGGAIFLNDFVCFTEAGKTLSVDKITLISKKWGNENLEKISHGVEAIIRLKHINTKLLKKLRPGFVFLEKN